MARAIRLLPAVVAMLPLVAAAADNGLGDKPYMGWSSWSYFAKPFDERAIRDEADVLAGRLKKYGYEYVNVDAGWTDHCDEFGRSQPDLVKIPDGIAGLAAYVHSKGLKFGLYAQPGIPTAAYNANCLILGTHYHLHDVGDGTKPGNTLGREYVFLDATKPGAADYVQSNVDLMASWGIDFLKIDFVGPKNNRTLPDTRPELALWVAALKKCKRPIWLELSNNVSLACIDDWRAAANGWRISGDVEVHRKGTLTDWNRIASRFKDAPPWAEFAGKGGWNDFDSLELGNGIHDGLTLDERRTTMTFWCICCVPLYLGSDLRTLDDTDYEIMTNAGAIAVDQAGHPGQCILQSDTAQVWRTTNDNGSYTIGLFNLDSSRQTVTAMWSDVGVHGRAKVRDTWSGIDLGTFDDHFSASLDPHASRLINVMPLTQR